MAATSVIYGARTAPFGNTWEYGEWISVDCINAVNSSTPEDARAAVSVNFDLSTASGSFSKLTLHVIYNQSTTDTDFTLYVNGVATALTLTIPAAQTGWFQTTTESATIATGDAVCYCLQGVESGITDLDITSVQMMLTEASASTAVWLLGSSAWNPFSGLIAFDNETRAVGPLNVDDQAVEYSYRYTVRTACTARNFQLYVSENSYDVGIIYTVLKNGSPTSITITIGAGQSGAFSDDTNTASFAVGDKLSFQVASDGTPSTGTAVVTATHLFMQSGSTAFDIVTGGLSGLAAYDQDTVSFGRTAGFSPHSSIAQQSDSYGELTHSQYAFKALFDGTLSKLAFAYTGYGIYEGYTDQPFYCRPMIAGVAGTQLIEIATPASPDEAAYANDATNTDAVVAGDEYYVEFGLSDLASATPDWGAEASIWSISASFTPADTGDEFGCTKTCEGSETYYSLVNKTLKMLGEDPDAPVYWTSAEIGRYVNDAYGDMAVETKALEFIEAVALTADNSTGTMSAYVLQPFRVTFDDYKIPATTKYELDRVQTDWENLSGYVDRYMTGLNDIRSITTYKAWDGTSYYAREFYFNDGAYTYTAWANSTSYVVDDRVTVTDADGIKTGYVCISAHTSATATNKPGSGTAWTDKWTPLALMVWATKTPADLSACDEPEFPCWAHISIAYKAASKALRKYGEQKNDALADVYNEIGERYWAMLRSFMSNRTPEKTMVVGQKTRVKGIRPWPWPPLVEV